MGNWTEAAADLRGAAGPPGRNSWAHVDLLRLGLVKLVAVDREGYRAACDELVDLARRFPDPAIAHSEARLLTLQPNPSAGRPDRGVGTGRQGGGEGQRAAELAAPSARPSVGTGTFDPAVAELGEVRRLEADAREAVWDDLFLAIAHARARRGDEAKRLLGRAGRSIQRLENPGPFKPPATVWQTISGASWCGRRRT